MSETLSFMVYFLMLVVYTTVLCREFGTRNGMILSISTLSFGFIVFRYVIPIFDNLNTIYGIIISVSAVSLGLVISISAVSLGLISRYILNPDGPFDEEYFNLASKKVNSQNFENVLNGLEHLYQLSKSDKSNSDKAFYCLCDSLKNKNDKVKKDLIVRYICKIYKDRINNKYQMKLPLWENI